MLLNLCDVLSVVGNEMTETARISDVSANVRGENIVISSKQEFEIVVKHIEKEIVTVAFDVVVQAQRTCSRCLETVECEYALTVFRNINVAKKEAYIDAASEADEISYIEDCNLDIDMLVLDELFTVIPMNVVCKDDCKGICKVCGTNLNESTCNCDQTVPDPRMAVFSDIFNQFKEV